jgi:hypothetical protein
LPKGGQNCFALRSGATTDAAAVLVLVNALLVTVSTGYVYMLCYSRRRGIGKQRWDVRSYCNTYEIQKMAQKEERGVGERERNVLFAAVNRIDVRAIKY